MEKELFIFDMDGTILNTIEDITNSVNYILEKYNYPLREVDEVKFFVGNGLLKTLQRSVPDDIQQDVVDIMYNEFVEYYKEHSNICTRPYDGVVEVILELRKLGRKVAVVSNKRVEAVRELCEIYFKGCFDLAYGDQDGIAKKPAPDMVNMVISHYGLPKEKVVYIGDSDVDIMTARNSNIDCISVAWGFRSKAFLEEHGAGVIIDSPRELLSIVS